MTGNLALYARISKAGDQTPENQLLVLRKYAQETGLKVYGEFVDEISSRDTRPQKEEVLKLARLGVVDTIAFVSLDRWGRNLAELVNEMQELPARGVRLISLREGLNFDSAAGRLYAAILAAFAGFERDINHERTVAGLERARAQGKRLGRHPHDCDCPKHKPGNALQGGFASVKLADS